MPAGIPPVIQGHSPEIISVSELAAVQGLCCPQYFILQVAPLKTKTKTPARCIHIQVKTADDGFCTLLLDSIIGHSPCCEHWEGAHRPFLIFHRL